MRLKIVNSNIFNNSINDIINIDDLYYIKLDDNLMVELTQNEIYIELYNKTINPFNIIKKNISNDDLNHNDFDLIKNRYKDFTICNIPIPTNK